MKKITLLILFTLISMVNHAQSYLSEDFGDASSLAQWTSVTLGGSSVWTHSPTDNAGTGRMGAMFLAGDNVVPGTGPYQKWLISPEMDLSTAVSPTLSFEAKSLLANNQGDKLKVMVTIFGPEDYADYVQLAEYTEYSPNASNSISQSQTGWGLNHVDLSGFSQEFSVRVAFVIESTGEGLIATSHYGDNWLLDNISVAERCNPVNGLSISAYGQSYANLTWSGNATSYDIEVALASGSFTGTPTYTTTNTFYRITGLSPVTEYKIRVRPNCDGTIGEWTTITLLTTQNFCNTMFYDSGGPNGNYSNNENYIVTMCPENAGEVIQVIFNAFNTQSSTDFLHVYRGSRVDATNLIGSYSGTALPPTFLATLANGGCLTFRFDSNASTNAAGWAAQVNCIPGPACAIPEDVAVVRTGADSATFSWTAGFEETAWEVVVIPAGSGNLANATVIPATSNPFTITNLQSATEYEFYVRAVCSSTNKSEWSSAVRFSTTQVLATLPYAETFDGTSTNFGFSNGTQVNKWVVGNAVSNSAPKSLYISNDNGTSNAYTLTSTTVAHAFRDIEIPANVLQAKVEFDWKAQGQTTVDYMRVWLVPSSYTPIAGTRIPTNIGAVQVGALYNLNGNWTRASYEVDASTFSGSVARLVFEWVNNNTTGTQSPAAVDNINVTGITCPKPILLAVSAVTQNSASLNWSAGSTESAWEYYIVPTGQPAPTANTNGTATGTRLGTTVSGLQPSTLYTYYVRAVCSTTDKSDWSEPFNFQTTQIPATLPYNENFDGSTVSIGLNNGTQVNKWMVGTATFNSADKSIYISNNNSANAYTVTTASVTHFFRDLAIPAGATVGNLRFDWKAQGQTTLDYIKVWLVPSSYSPTAGTSIVAGEGRIAIGNIYNQSSNWVTTESDVALTSFAGGNARLIFEWVNNATTGTQPPGAIDNISFVQVTCPRPTDIVVNNVTSDTATISWNNGATETSWEYIVLPAGSPIPDATVQGIATSTNPTTIPGLVPGGAYTVYVRSICSATDKSLWSVGVNFNTTQIPATMPYVENFDGTTVSIGVNNGTQPNKWFLGTATFNSPGKSMYISNDNGNTNTYTVTTASVTHFYRDVAIPTGALLGNLQFDWKAQGEGTVDYIRVWLVPATYNLVPGTQITAGTGRLQIGNIYNRNGAWQTESIDVSLTQFANSTAKLVFEWRNDGSVGTMPPGAVDNINFSVVTCPRPTTIVLNTVTADSATISWTNGGTETAWEYIILPTGSPVPASTATGTPVTTTPVTITGLNPGVAYDVYVRAVCSTTDVSVWSLPLSFSTTQIPASLPYVENFDGTEVAIGINNGTQTNKWFLGTATFNSPNKSMYISNDNGVSNAYTINTASVTHFYRDIAIPTGAALGNLQFDWKAQGESTLDYIRVWLVPSTFNPVAGTQVAAATGRVRIGDIFNRNGSWQTANVDVELTQFAGSTARLVFEWRNDTSVGTQPPGAVDNINFTLVSCPKPTALVLNSVTSDTAVINWTNGSNETAWEYIVLPTGSPAPATTLDGTPTTTKPLTLNGLEPGVSYDVYIRAVCSETDKSLWSIPLTITTTQIPASMPYEENFDGQNTVIGISNGTQTNKWSLGTATFNSPTKSMYITNDNGVSNAYTTTSASVVHFYRDIQVPAGSILGALQFDWKGFGESSFDYLRAWIVPTTFVPTAGTQIAAATGRTQIGGNYNQSATWNSVSQDVNLTAYAGQTIRLIFEWRNDASAGTQPPGAIDNIVFAVVTCPRVSNLTVTGGTEDSLTINWTPGSTETQWEVYYVPTGQPAPTANTAGQLITTRPYTITGLNPSTTYNIYIRPVCSETDKGIWVNTSGTTSQIPASLPYNEQFNADSQFQFSNGTQTNKWVIGTAAFTTADTGMYISNTNGTTNNYVNTTSAVQAYRDIAIPAGSGEVSIEFDWRSNGQTTLDYMNVFVVPSTFTPTAGTIVTEANSGGRLIRTELFNLNNNWTRFQNNVSVADFAGQNMRIIFQWVNNATTNNQFPAAVDNLSIYIPTCPRPINLTSVAPNNSNVVTLGWTPTGQETAWEVVVLPAGTVPNATTTGTIVSTPSFTFTAENNVLYEYYVRAVCSSTDKSLWAGPQGFSVFTPPGCAQIDVVGVGVNVIDNRIYICPDNPTEDVTLQAEYFGIGATTSYQVSAIDYTPPFPFIGGTQMPITSDDDFTASFNLPFNFCFFGNSYNYCRIGDNGLISFGMPYTTTYGEYCDWDLEGLTIPNTGFSIKNSIYGIYQDMYTTNNPGPNSQINYQVLGNYPCRALVVNFNEVPAFSCSEEEYRTTTQIVLYEISNIIEIYVKKRVPCMDWPSGGRAGQGVIGIQNAAGTVAYTPPGRNTGAWTAQTEAWRFTPNGPSDVSITWTHEGTVIGNQDTVTLPVSEDTQVLATATYLACDGSTVVTESVIDIVVTREMPTLEPNTLYLCTGQNVYDLTLNEDYVLSESNPLHYNVYFYTSEALAIANDPTTAILDPENYQGTQGETIWMNVSSLGGCSIVKSFLLGQSYPSPEFTLQGDTSVCSPNTSTITIVPTNFTLEDAVIVVTDPEGNEHPQSTGIITLPINNLSGTYTFTVTKGCTGTQTLNFTYGISAPTPIVDVIDTTCNDATGTIEITGPLSTTSGVRYTDIFISEVTDHESGGTTYVEIFNPTTEAKDLSTYKLQVNTNSSSCNVPMEGIIQPNSTFIIAVGLDTPRGNVTPDFVSTCQGVNDNDQIIIARADDSRVDVWGYDTRITFTPTSAGYVYRRLNTVNAPSTTFNPTDWSTLSSSNYSDVGTYVPGVSTQTNYEYSINGGTTFQTGTIFENVAPGTYPVVVREPGNACLSEVVEVTINPQPTFDAVTIASSCIDSNFTLTASPSNVNYTYTWYDASGNVVSNSQSFVPSEIGGYMVQVNYNADCSSTASIYVDNVSCSNFIPKGISPNGDGLNDAFDISGLRAKSVKIYNRHGREVYSHGAGYTNQWYGQTKEGKDLPDATYYYVIEDRDGKVHTGWVYISREVR